MEVGNLKVGQPMWRQMVLKKQAISNSTTSNSRVYLLVLSAWSYHDPTINKVSFLKINSLPMVEYDIYLYWPIPTSRFKKCKLSENKFIGTGRL